MNIFTCYRRADSANITGRIYDRLVSAFGDQNVFRVTTIFQRGKIFERILKAQKINER